MPYANTSEDDADQLGPEAEMGNTTQVEEWLSRPQKPPLVQPLWREPSGFSMCFGPPGSCALAVRSLR